MTDEKLNDKFKDKWWCSTVIEQLKQGKSNRAIAKDVFGKSDDEYRIRRLLKQNWVQKELGLDVTTSKRELKTLYFDVENSPCEYYGWGRFDQSFSQDQVKRESHLLTISFATNDDEVKSFKLSVDDVINQDDLTLVANLAQAINESDVIVGFNSKKFDLKVLKTRMLLWGLPPLQPKKHIDIMQQAKQHFRFPSNSMDNICKYLGYSVLKQNTGGFTLWRRCMETQNREESAKALEEMELYNRQDIEVTRNLYKKMQGWFTGVNVGTMTNQITGNHTLRCSKCGSDYVYLDKGFHYTAQSAFSFYRCSNCLGVSRMSKKVDKESIGRVSGVLLNV